MENVTLSALLLLEEALGYWVATIRKQLIEMGIDSTVALL